MSGVRVTNLGIVYNGERMVGYVDRHDPENRRRSSLWRAVLEGGRYKYGFKTRRAAVEWLTVGHFDKANR